MRRRDDWLARGLAAASTPLLPAWAAVTALHPRLRDDWRERWGLEVAPVSLGAVWIHAASVGEVAAAEALIDRLDVEVLLTTDTDTGARAARRLAQRWGSRVVAAARPVDHPWVLAPLWAEARPRAVVFVEGTWWPQLAARAARASVPVLRVSAKAGGRTRSLGRAWVSRPLTGLTQLVVARDMQQAEWFAAGRAPVVVGGNLKADRRPGSSPLRWSRPFVVGASTHSGEEKALLDAVDALTPRPQLLLAPRDPRRFDEVAALLTIRGRSFVRRSALKGDQIPGTVDVVLLDTMGELRDLMPGALAAFVGGTFQERVGGHSPWEARAAGVPVVCGPHTSGQGQAFVGAQQAQRPEDLLGALERAIASGPPPTSVGAGARTAGWVLERLSAPAPDASPRPWLRGLAPLYAAGSLAWTALHQGRATRRVRLGVPVVCVGSTSSRGPGRTSTVAWMAREATARGHKVGIAVRGYKRTVGGRGLFVSDTHPHASHLGDEGALHAQRGFLVAACPDRSAAARALEAKGCTLVVLDDGLQHHRLVRDVDLVVLDARRLEAGGVLPAGERREWVPVPLRVDGVILHHGSAKLRLPASIPVAHATRTLGAWHRAGVACALPEGPLAAFAGVARPADVRESLPRTVTGFRALADHEPISEALAHDLVAWANGRPLLCTAKDWVRLPPSLRDEVYWRDLTAEVCGAPEAWFPAPATR